MNTGRIREQARFLFQFGKRMRDQMLKVHMTSVLQGEDNFGEGLSPPQVHMLLAIKENQECTITELAAHLEVSPPSVSVMVDRLVEKDALVRERSHKDRRVVVVSLSARAADHIGRMEKAMLESFIEVVEKVGPELAEKWCSVIKQVDNALHEGKA
jgi:DNA-binding MarR family transcriptional regulator